MHRLSYVVSPFFFYFFIFNPSTRETVYKSLRLWVFFLFFFFIILITQGGGKRVIEGQFRRVFDIQLLLADWRNASKSVDFSFFLLCIVEEGSSVPLDPCRKATLDELANSITWASLRRVRYSSFPLKKKKKIQDKTRKNDPSTSHFLSFRIYGPQSGRQYSYFRWRYLQARRDRHCHSNNDPIPSHLKETKTH